MAECLADVCIVSIGKAYPVSFWFICSLFSNLEICPATKPLATLCRFSGGLFLTWRLTSVILYVAPMPQSPRIPSDGSYFFHPYFFMFIGIRSFSFKYYNTNIWSNIRLWRCAEGEVRGYVEQIDLLIISTFQYLWLVLIRIYLRFWILNSFRMFEIYRHNLL